MARVGTEQIALFATPEGVLACNNRCPHEGYPLSEGTLDGACGLTCNWHNWKFDLDDGANLLGGDRLRTYPVELRDGEYWVEVADPPAGERRREIARACATLSRTMNTIAWRARSRLCGRRRRSVERWPPPSAGPTTGSNSVGLMPMRGRPTGSRSMTSRAGGRARLPRARGHGAYRGHGAARACLSLCESSLPYEEAVPRRDRTAGRGGCSRATERRARPGLGFADLECAFRPRRSPTTTISAIR